MDKNIEVNQDQKEKYIRTNIVAGVVVKQDSKYLLVQENCPGTKVHGLWNFPAGRVERGDTIEETAIKEAKEESGYDVKLIRKIGIFQETAEQPSAHVFEAMIVGGKLGHLADDILDVEWFSYQEIKEMKDKLRGGWVTGVISILEK
jgi:8-oxo-dGTP diphosphatase